MGAGLIRALQRSQPDRQIIILSRRPESISTRGKVTAIRSDLREPNLGMDLPAYRLLQARITGIVHCAADLKFTTPLESARRTNVDGARGVLEFAERCPNLQKLAHISTLYIAGMRPGTVHEEPLFHDAGYFNVYEQSKHEAEQLVIGRMRQLPACIYRLSSIIGDSRTGEAAQHNYFHGLIRLLPRAAEIREIPGDPAVPVDLIPDDWCVSALACLFQDHFRGGSIHHLCAGPALSLNAGQLLDLLFSVYNSVAAQAVPTPRLHRFPAPGDRQLKQSGFQEKVIDLCSTFLPHLVVRQPFDRGTTGALLASHGIHLPQTGPFVSRVIQRIVAGMTWRAQG